ncbi:MAG: MMPL family transporter [Holophaga sp.]
MRPLAWLWILVLALLAGVGAARLARGGAVETDLLAMLPRTGRDPVAEQAIRSLAQAAGDRVVFLLGPAPEAEVRTAALDFAGSLEQSGAFAQVTGRVPPLDPGIVPRFYAPYRFRLPAPGPSSGTLEQRVQAALAAPLGAVPGTGPGLDPLGEFGAFLAALPLAGLGVQVEDGLLTARGADGLHVLVSARLKGSAFDPAVQAASLDAAAAAEHRLRAGHPGIPLLRTGALFYAADARARAEWETGLISWGSLAAVVTLFLLVFRSARHLLAGLGCVGAGLAAALAATLLAFGRIHLLTLVMGASLVGVAVDYPMLYFAHHLGAGPGWNARGALVRLLPALALGLATTLLGYAALGAAPFPALRQMAVFSMAGLGASFLTVVLVLPGALAAPVPPRPRLMTRLERVLERWGDGLRRFSRRGGWLLCALLAAAAIPRLRVDDDVRGLVQPSARLQAQEERIRALTGLSGSGRFFLVRGRGEGEVLAREEALRARLQPLVAGGELDGIQAVSAFVPSPARQEAALEARRRQAPELERTLGGLGFTRAAVAGFGRDLRSAADRPLTVDAWTKAPFSLSFRQLWLGSTGGGAASVVYPAGPCGADRLRQAAAGLEGVALVDQAGSVSDLLGRYRRVAEAALGLAVLLVWVLLARWYGLRRGIRVLAPTLGGMLAALGAVALLGQPLTLFHTIALVLVLGFGVDYAVFLAEAGDRPAPALLGVLLAGFATLLSYGLLVFSGTPALRGFGVTLGLGVLGSVLLAPLARREAPDRKAGSGAGA